MRLAVVAAMAFVLDGIVKDEYDTRQTSLRRPCPNAREWEETHLFIADWPALIVNI